MNIISNDTCSHYAHTGQPASHMRPHRTPCAWIMNVTLSFWSTLLVRDKGSSISYWTDGAGAVAEEVWKSIKM